MDSYRDKDIHRLEHEGRDVTNPKDIIDIMQKWYETIAQDASPQLSTWTSFRSSMTYNSRSYLKVTAVFPLVLRV